MSDKMPELGAGPLGDLDAVIAQLETERRDAARLLARSHGTDAEALAIALKALDDKLADARRHREELGKRVGRAARMRQLAAETRAVRLELERLVKAGDRGARFEQLRRRAQALAAEAATLKDSG